MLTKNAPELIARVSELDLSSPDKDLVNDLRGAVGGEISAEMFEGDKKAEEYGWELENLIDRLADLYIWPELKSRKQK